MLLLALCPVIRSPAPQGPAVGPAPALHPGRSGGADTLVPSRLKLVRSGAPVPCGPPHPPHRPNPSSRGPDGLWPESLPPPCPARPASFPGSRRARSPAPRPHPAPAPHAGASSFPVPTQGPPRGHPCFFFFFFCTRRGGKSPGHAEACGGACDAQARPHTSASSHDGGTAAEAPEAPADPPPGHSARRARTHATHARMHAPQPGRVPPAPPAAGSVTWARRGKPRESSPPGA